MGQTADEIGIPRTKNERPKGFTIYAPQADSDRGRYMDAAQQEIEDQPASRTTRFIAYRTAAALGAGHEQVDNIEEAVLMLRRSRRVPIDAVRDGRSTWEVPWTATTTEAAETLRDAIGNLRHDRQDGQPWRVVLLLEAAGLLPTLAPVADAYGVPMVSGSGSVPLTVTHALAGAAVEHYRETGVPTAILSIGDFDLMGLRNIFVPAAQDIEKFATDYGAREAVRVERIAATPEQIREHIPANLLLPAPTQKVNVIGPDGKPLRNSDGKLIKQEVPVPWWPADFQLPTAEALEDVLPDIVTAELDRFLPDADQRQQWVDAEPDQRRETAQELTVLLAA